MSRLWALHLIVPLPMAIFYLVPLGLTMSDMWGVDGQKNEQNKCHF